MRKLSVMICLCILGFTGDTNAWGWEGHKLVCALAEEQFSNEAKKMVNHLLADGSKLKGGQKNFPAACLWPDDVKYSSRKGTYEHHFINVPDDANRIDLQRDCAALNCIAVGLQQALHYLSLPARGDRDKLRRAAALRFLGHYVADLHQPLHVGNASDWGGNKLKVRWRNKSTNLHALWDYGLLEAMNITYPKSLPVLRSVPTQPFSGNAYSWLNESLLLARKVAYVNSDGRLIESGDSLGEDYFNRSKPVLLERMALAAARLAHLLNEIAAGRKPEAFSLKGG